MNPKEICLALENFRKKEEEDRKPENRLKYVFSCIRDNARLIGKAEFKSYEGYFEYNAIVDCTDYLENLGYIVEHGTDDFEYKDRIRGWPFGLGFTEIITKVEKRPFVVVKFNCCVTGEAPDCAKKDNRKV